MENPDETLEPMTKRQIRTAFLEAGISEEEFEQDWPAIREELLEIRQRGEDETYRQQFREHMLRTF